jgi:cellulose synthase/poly-beta-1,6-N-acetylglucosamine synthase-like glycosyltransferase
MTVEILRLLDDGLLLTGLALFCLIGASLPWVVVQYLYLRRKGLAREAELLSGPLPLDDRLPHVLVQLPTFNDGPVIGRVAEASGNLDWPRDRLHIQILDDSTDGSTEIAREAVATLRSRGIDAVLLHRTTRSGFKGAALQAGLHHSNHEYVAVFDADFVPPPDFLRRCLGVLLSDPDLAFVQARWDGLNASENALTRAQQHAIDAYCVVHQTARAWSGLFVQFMGSCAVWRRAALDDLGGWTSDILPEDLDISYRALLRGWRTLCLATASVPGELPHTRVAWQRQQYRWSNGLTQAMRKYLPAVWRSNVPLRGKIAASLCLANCTFGPVAGIVAIAGAIHLLLGGKTSIVVLALAAIAMIEIAFAMVGIMLGQRFLRGIGAWRSLPPALAGVIVLLYSQLAVALSVLDAIRGKAATWTSTPKRGSQLSVSSQQLAPAPGAERPSE